MDKLDGKSKDIVEDNIEKLKKIFPEVIIEGKIDFDSLKETLGSYLDDREEGYNFNWNGKSQARQIAQAPSTGTLRPCKEESVNWDKTENLFIEGDNLEVLKLLQKSYHKKVKMIYIDPPYNTGKDFIYKDDFRDNIKNYLEITGQVDGEGKKLSVNPETSGRYHTDWLNMMYPRLKLASNLLRDDGVIFISIDDNEVNNLRKICDEIFGEENFVAEIIVQANKGGRDYLQIAKTHEYLLCYLKKVGTELFLLPKKDISSFKYSDLNGKYELRELRNRNPKFHRGNRPNLYFPIYINPTLKDNYACCAISLSKNNKYHIEIFPKNSKGNDSCWRWGKILLSKNISKDNPSESNVVAKKKNDSGWNIYEKNRKTTTKAKSIWDDKDVRTERGTIVFRELFGKSLIEFPKPIELIMKAMRLGLGKEGIVLDFFAGSASTAHAAIELNFSDNENRKFIMVQIPEPTSENSEAYKAGYKTIADIGKERIRRVIKKIESEQEEQKKKNKETLFNENEPDEDKKLDLGFKVFKLDSSNIKTWDSDFENLEQNLLDSVDNIKSDRSTEDVLYEILLKCGLDLTVPIEERIIANKKVYSVGLGALIICLEKDISNDVIEGIIELKEELKPEVIRVVFSDSSFEDDVIKTNTVQILKQHGIEDVRSI